MSESEFTTIYSDDRLTLAAPLVTKHLIVHLGTPGPSIEAGGYVLSYNTVEYIGRGSFTIMRNGREASKVVQP